MSGRVLSEEEIREIEILERSGPVTSKNLIATIRNRDKTIEELRLEVIASKPLYSRRQLEEKNAILREAVEFYAERGMAKAREALDKVGR